MNGWKLVIACLATLGLAMAGQRAFAAEETYLLIVKKVEVHKTNKENQAWDLNNGAPDLQVIVRNLDKKSGEEGKTKQVLDSYSATYKEPLKLKVRKGQTLEFKVIDKDFDLDDEVGKTQKKIEEAGTLKLEKFGRVILLEIEVKKID